MNTCEVAIDAGKELQGEDSINVGITFSRQTTTAILQMDFEYISALNTNTFVIILAYTKCKDHT